jgi:hypothetical protein
MLSRLAVHLALASLTFVFVSGGELRQCSDLHLDQVSRWPEVTRGL